MCGAMISAFVETLTLFINIVLSDSELGKVCCVGSTDLSIGQVKSAVQPGSIAGPQLAGSG